MLILSCKTTAPWPFLVHGGVAGTSNGSEVENGQIRDGDHGLGPYLDHDLFLCPCEAMVNDCEGVWEGMASGAWWLKSKGEVE